MLLDVSGGGARLTLNLAAQPSRMECEWHRPQSALKLNFWRHSRRCPTPPRGAPSNAPKEGGGYSAENITVLEGLTAVRLRPAMYIGSTGEQGLHHLVYEVVDNSVDEALGGHATRIDVTIHVDNSITVVDDGRGIPVDDKVINGEKMPAVQVVLTMLHAGGKFDASNYKVSGGLHGVGVSCVNALSQEFDVEIWRDGFAWEQDYAKGIPTSKLRKMGAVEAQGHEGPLPARQVDLYGDGVQLRHAGAAAARARVPEQGA